MYDANFAVAVDPPLVNGGEAVFPFEEVHLQIMANLEAANSNVKLILRKLEAREHAEQLAIQDETLVVHCAEVVNIDTDIRDEPHTAAACADNEEIPVKPAWADLVDGDTDIPLHAAAACAHEDGAKTKKRGNRGGARRHRAAPAG